MENWIFILAVVVLLDLFFTAYIILARRRGFSKKEQQEFAQQWQRVRANPDFRHAVLDGDKLLDQLLRRKGYSGTLGEKLKKVAKSGTLSDLDGVWSAHKLRNRIAHELDARVTHDDARRALSQFERAYRDLGMKG